MSPEDAFLLTIAANPTDNVPRLIYADWLEETGIEASIARAELIRIQIELETAILELEQLAAIHQRQRELLEQYGSIWAGPLGVEGIHWFYRRGFMDRFAHRGLFRSRHGHSNDYLRFYRDGRVITIGSSREPSEIARRFTREWPELSQGDYELFPGRSCLGLHFSSTDSFGTVDYRGSMEGHVITLDTQSRINGYRGRSRYVWVDIPDYDSLNDKGIMGFLQTDED